MRTWHQGYGRGSVQSRCRSTTKTQKQHNNNNSNSLPETKVFPEEAFNAAEADLPVNLVGGGGHLVRELVTQS